jgi:alkanesulfonate monooxygenase SsuD/methylene tetrahydromethanopterin reductase-like flavin-dependent oxidoreductase (luciferase family)
VRIGITLPSHIPGVGPDDVLAWARRAEQLGFATLAAMDRVVHEDLEALTTLTAAAVATERIGLLTNVLIVPQRISAAVLAKQLATIDAFAAGRLSVGIGVGDRERDYQIAGADARGRFDRVDEMIEQMRAIWRGEDAEASGIGPRPPRGRPAIYLGGRTERALRRVVRHDAGWTMALGTPERFSESVERLGQLRAETGRGGTTPTIVSTYFALGADAARSGPGFVREYFSFVGPYAEHVAQATPTDADAVTAAIAAYAALGADELIFIPTSTPIEQLELLAELVQA